MTNFFERTAAEQETIRNAYDFEIAAIENNDSSRNPFFNTIKAWIDGQEILEAINEAVEMVYV